MPVTKTLKAEKAVLHELDESSGPQKPATLIKRVKEKQTGLSELAVREALWRLIDRTEVHLTENRKISRHKSSG